jgi:MtrB/PioB family decaheme-associated outer membrane protein
MKAFTLVLGAAFLLSSAAAAQETPPVAVSGSITTGARQVDSDTTSSKLTEYRDLRDTALVPRLTFELFDSRSGQLFEFSGTNIGLNDQTLSLRGGTLGLWRASVDWSDVPHNFSNKAQTPYIRRGAGLFEVPANVPITFKRLATAAADAPNVVASDQLIAAYQAAYLRPTGLATQNAFGRVALAYEGPVALGLTYDRQRKSGLKSAFGPIGDRPPRTLNIQLTEPVDHRTNDLTVRAEHVGDRVNLQVSYQFSDFANGVDTLVWENVYATALPDLTYDTWDRSVSAYGRRPLAPDNRYHHASISAGGDVPGEGRVNATFAYGRLEQNESLLPYSFNADVLAVQALPRSTANAEIGTRQLLVDYVVNPAPRLNVRAWVRYSGVDNNTPEANWQYVTSDTSNLNGTTSYKNRRVNVAYASDRTFGGVEANWRIRRGALALGYERENVDREYREADTTEDRVTASFRMRPARWANLRARYVFGSRDGDYDPFAPSQSYWYAQSDAGTDQDNPRFTFSNHPDMRRFDVADRQRHQTDVTLTLSPRGTFSLSGSVRYRSDDFDSGVASIQPLAGSGLADQNAATPGDQLGLLEDSRLRYSVDAFYMPVDRFSLNAFLSMDRGAAFERSLEFNENNKQNPSAVASAELGPWTRATSQWTADVDDKTWTAGLGTTLGLVPERVLLTGTYTLSLARLDIEYGGFGVTNWNGAPFPPNHQFAFTTPPTIRVDLHALDLRLEFPLARGVSFLVGYGYEHYRLDDWQQSASQPWVEPVGSEFLLRDTSRSHQWGNRLFNLGTYLAPSYNAHFGFAAFSYRF